jgi:hypothetical protein
MWVWRNQSGTIDIPACQRLLEAYIRAPPSTADLHDPRFWLSMAFGEVLKELEELRSGVKAPVVDRNSTTVPDGKKPQVSEIELLRRVSESARGYLNASSDEMCKYRLGSLENSLRELETDYPPPGAYALTPSELPEPISVERPVGQIEVPIVWEEEVAEK